MQYTLNPPLDETHVLPDPLAQFEAWMAAAQQADLVDATAMSLATAVDGRPSVRIVLFKGLVDGGFSFYTNYESRKGRELAANPHAAATFWWDRLERQVRIEGTVERVSRELSDQYFHLRPRGSQLGALTSRQSQVIASRSELETRLEVVAAQFADQPVPLPDYWGGYRLVPHYLEFWQGRPDRLHDRLIYSRDRDGSGWTLQRLEP